MADSKTTALSELSVPSLTDLLYTIDDPGGTPVSNKLTTTRALGLMGLIPGGRLTLTTAVPVTTSDVTAAGTLYYTPYLHTVIRVWDGTRWLVKNFAEISLALTLTDAKNYDVFVDDDAATLSLSAAWTNDTTRADALGTQDSVIVLNSDKTKLWLGTIRASGANTTEDSVTKRFVWNRYNQVLRNLTKADGTGHTYNSATFRSWNNDATNQIAWVVGSIDESFTLSMYADVTASHTTTDSPVVYGVVDWTSGAGGELVYGVILGATTVRSLNGNTGIFRHVLGYHYMRAIEGVFSATTATFNSLSLFAGIMM